MIIKWSSSYGNLAYFFVLKSEKNDVSIIEES